MGTHMKNNINKQIDFNYSECPTRVLFIEDMHRKMDKVIIIKIMTKKDNTNGNKLFQLEHITNQNHNRNPRCNHPSVAPRNNRRSHS